jgi:serine/threonine-protein kinase
MKTHLGHYDIVSELGRGGMGVVYKGYEASLNRYVAIKVLADSLAHDASVKERFLREARSMASLNDPHIIQIYFIGDDEGQTFFVMEFVDGESLGSVLKRESKLKPEQAAKIIYQTALGLSTAHDRGVIHRDIKPGNLMLTARGSVKIADFGIALTTQDFSKKLTSTGEFVGTPGYLSPEVCLGKPVDQRSDIFSLGIVLFECLAGRMPFTDESPLGLMLEVVKAEIPDVCTLNSEVDAELSRVLTRMIAKDPAERYQSCHELVADLGQHPLVARGGPITLQTKMTTAAATMIGQKTPVSGQQSLPSTTPTPRPMPAMGSATPRPASATTAARAAPDLGAPVHQSVLERGAAPKRSPLPLAIAAIAFLLLVSAAWAFRDRIPAQLAQWFPSQVAAPANDSAPAPRASQVEPLRDLAAAQAAQAPPPKQRVASATPPPPVGAPPRPHVPTIAVIAGGDEAVAEPAQHSIEHALSRNGFHLVDEASMPRVEHLLQGSKANTAEILNVIAHRGGIDVVVVIHARAVGSQSVTFYGQSDNLMTAQLNITAYAVEGRRKLGSGWSDNVNFTAMSAKDKAEEAVEPLISEIEERLAEFRAARKG